MSSIRPSHRISKTTRTGFTLVELLVSMSVLTLLILLITQLFNQATSITTTGNKHMDADGQGRPVLDRMAIDFAQMVKRADVDYFLKQTGNSQTGNDQIAFYSEVPGYSSSSPGSISLVAYRVGNNTTNAYAKMQRLGKGLVWNGSAATDSPVVYLPLTVAATWPSATNMAADNDYETVGPQVFRFEYAYVLKSGLLSDVPWDAVAGNTAVNGLQDVSAISVAIAVMDPKSRILVADTQLATLAGQMNDFDKSKKPGDMEAQWQAAVDASAIPRVSASAIRIYHRYFSLAPRLP